MRVINSVKNVVTVVMGTPAVHPMGLAIILPTGQSFTGATFLPTYIRYDITSNMSIRPTLNRFFYSYIFGMLPSSITITGHLLRNTVKRNGNDIELHTIKSLNEIATLITRASAGYAGAPVQVILASDGLAPNSDLFTLTGFLQTLRFEFATDADMIGWFVLQFVGPMPKVF